MTPELIHRGQKVFIPRPGLKYICAEITDFGPRTIQLNDSIWLPLRIILTDAHVNDTWYIRIKPDFKPNNYHKWWMSENEQSGT